MPRVHTGGGRTADADNHAQEVEPVMRRLELCEPLPSQMLTNTDLISCHAVSNTVRRSGPPSVNVLLSHSALLPPFPRRPPYRSPDWSPLPVDLEDWSVWHAESNRRSRSLHVLTLALHGARTHLDGARPTGMPRTAFSWNHRSVTCPNKVQKISKQTPSFKLSLTQAISSRHLCCDARSWVEHSWFRVTTYLVDLRIRQTQCLQSNAAGR